MCLVVEGEQPGEVEAVYHFVERINDGGDALLHQGRQSCIGDAKAGFLRRLLLHVADPPIQNQGQRTALGLGFGGHVANELLVGGKALPLGALQAPLGGQIRVHHHEVFRHHVVADGLQQEALAAAVFSHDEAEGGAPVGDDFHIMQQGVDLLFPAYGDIGQPHPGHHAAFQGVHQGLGNSFWYFHGEIISFSSSR